MAEALEYTGTLCRTEPSDSLSAACVFDVATFAVAHPLAARTSSSTASLSPTTLRRPDGDSDSSDSRSLSRSQLSVSSGDLPVLPSPTTGATTAAEVDARSHSQQLEKFSAPSHSLVIPPLSFTGSSEATRGHLHGIVSVSLTHIETREGSGGGGGASFAVYGIRVALHSSVAGEPPTVWTVFRRYSEFLELHRGLQRGMHEWKHGGSSKSSKSSSESTASAAAAAAGAAGVVSTLVAAEAGGGDLGDLPPFPSSHSITDWAKSALLHWAGPVDAAFESRRVALEIYLRGLVRVTGAWMIGAGSSNTSSSSSGGGGGGGGRDRGSSSSGIANSSSSSSSTGMGHASSGSPGAVALSSPPHHSGSVAGVMMTSPSSPSTSLAVSPPSSLSARGPRSGGVNGERQLSALPLLASFLEGPGGELAAAVDAARLAGAQRMLAFVTVTNARRAKALERSLAVTREEVRNMSDRVAAVEAAVAAATAGGAAAATVVESIPAPSSSTLASAASATNAAPTAAPAAAVGVAITPSTDARASGTDAPSTIAIFPNYFKDSGPGGALGDALLAAGRIMAGPSGSGSSADLTMDTDSGAGIRPVMTLITNADGTGTAAVTAAATASFPSRELQQPSPTGMDSAAAAYVANFSAKSKQQPAGSPTQTHSGVSPQQAADATSTSTATGADPHAGTVPPPPSPSPLTHRETEAMLDWLFAASVEGDAEAAAAEGAQQQTPSSLDEWLRSLTLVSNGLLRGGNAPTLPPALGVPLAPIAEEETGASSTAHRQGAASAAAAAAPSATSSSGWKRRQGRKGFMALPSSSSLLAAAAPSSSAPAASSTAVSGPSPPSGGDAAADAVARVRDGSRRNSASDNSGRVEDSDFDDDDGDAAAAHVPLEAQRLQQPRMGVASSSSTLKFPSAAIMSRAAAQLCELWPAVRLVPPTLPTSTSSFGDDAASPLGRLLDCIIEGVAPTAELEARRSAITQSLRALLSDAVGGWAVFPTGSSVTRTYLSSSDIDLSLFMPRGMEASAEWFTKVTEALLSTCGQPHNNASINGSSSTSYNSSSSSSSEGHFVDPASSGVRGAEAAVASAPVAIAVSEVSGRGGGNGGSSSSGSWADFPPFIASDVEFINADVRIVRCNLNQGEVAVDISCNSVGALAAAAFLEAADAAVGHAHLFKRSLLLLKAWLERDALVMLAAAAAPALDAAATASSSSSPPPASSLPPGPFDGTGTFVAPFDGPLLDSGRGGLSSYALAVLLFALFNAHPRCVRTPMQAFALFLEEYAEFPWGSHVVSVLHRRRHAFLPQQLPPHHFQRTLPSSPPPPPQQQQPPHGQRMAGGPQPSSPVPRLPFPTVSSSSSSSSPGAGPCCCCYEPFGADASSRASACGRYLTLAHLRQFRLLVEGCSRELDRSQQQQQSWDPASDSPRGGRPAAHSNASSVASDASAAPSLIGGGGGGGRKGGRAARGHAGGSSSSDSGHAMGSNSSAHTPRQQQQQSSTPNSPSSSIPLSPSLFAPHSAAPRAPFDVRNMNIEDPVIEGRNLSKSVSRAAASAITAVLRTGRERVRHALTLIRGEGGGGDGAIAAGGAHSSAAVAILASLFPRTYGSAQQAMLLQQQQGGSTHSTSSSSAAAPLLPSRGCIALLGSEPHSVNYAAAYAALLLSKRLTIPGVASIIVSLLSDHGAIPVGELGKLVLGASGMRDYGAAAEYGGGGSSSASGGSVTASSVGGGSLSNSLSLNIGGSFLRDSFGGLKRFLEVAEASELVTLGREHPFNPLVELHAKLRGVAE